MLQNLVDGVILATLRRFHERALALAEATEAQVAALQGDGDVASAREAARAAWRDAMTAWQEAEVMQVGPAGPPRAPDGSGRIGGQALRDEIYSWPGSVNPCGIDQLIVANEFREEGYFDRKLVQVYGLDALEYVLFYDGTDNACPGAASINSQGQWDALSEEEIVLRRAEYAHAAAKHLKGDAAELLTAWDDFRGQILEPGKEGSLFWDEAEAIDEIVAAMFYLDTQVKERKLAVPAGMHADCPNETCPDKLESRFAKHSKQNLIANLQAFERLLLGKGADGEDGLGFDDYLKEAGAADLAENMKGNLVAALDAFQSYEGALEDRLVDDVESVRGLHATVKQITDDLKGDFLTVLRLNVPQEGGGDTD